MYFSLCWELLESTLLTTFKYTLPVVFIIRYKVFNWSECYIPCYKRVLSTTLMRKHYSHFAQWNKEDPFSGKGSSPSEATAPHTLTFTQVPACRELSSYKKTQEEFSAEPFHSWKDPYLLQQLEGWHNESGLRHFIKPLLLVKEKKKKLLQLPKYCFTTENKKAEKLGSNVPAAVRKTSDGLTSESL